MDFEAIIKNTIPDGQPKFAGQPYQKSEPNGNFHAYLSHMDMTVLEDACTLYEKHYRLKTSGQTPQGIIESEHAMQSAFAQLERHIHNGIRATAMEESGKTEDALSSNYGSYDASVYATGITKKLRAAIDLSAALNIGKDVQKIE